MVVERELPGKGRALVADRALRAGEVALQELPALLVVEEDCLSTICANCLQLAQQGHAQACSCGAVFCCKACRIQATQSAYWHPPHVCEALQKLDRSGLLAEDATSLRLLVHLKAAKAAATALPQQGDGLGRDRRASAQVLWNIVLRLSCGQQAHPLAADLYRRLSEATADAPGLTEPQVAELLCKESCNSYGIMAPSGPEGERRVRGSGIYGSASLLNHECLPNTARCDSFDARTLSGRPGDTSLRFVALHDIPAGEELIASYFPLTCTYKERQQRCRDVYGFECRCARCQVESTWREDEDVDEDEDENMVEERPQASVEGETAGGIDSSYIQVYMLKYLCPQEECFGTMVPVLGTNGYQCNMCSFTRTEDDFMRELQQY